MLTETKKQYLSALLAKKAKKEIENLEKEKIKLSIEEEKKAEALEKEFTKFLKEKTEEFNKKHNCEFRSFVELRSLDNTEFENKVEKINNKIQEITEDYIETHDQPYSIKALELFIDAENAVKVADLKKIIKNVKFDD